MKFDCKINVLYTDFSCGNSYQANRYELVELGPGASIDSAVLKQAAEILWEKLNFYIDQVIIEQIQDVS